MQEYELAAYKDFWGSKPWHTYVKDAPLVKAAMLPITIPKQWYKGTGTHILSLTVYPHF